MTPRSPETDGGPTWHRPRSAWMGRTDKIPCCAPLTQRPPRNRRRAPRTTPGGVVPRSAQIADSLASGGGNQGTLQSDQPPVPGDSAEWCIPRIRGTYRGLVTNSVLHHDLDAGPWAQPCRTAVPRCPRQGSAFPTSSLEGGHSGQRQLGDRVGTVRAERHGAYPLDDLIVTRTFGPCGFRMFAVRVPAITCGRTQGVQLGGLVGAGAGTSAGLI
jgi:hypothetical protein